ncbi:alkaline phosphatase D family protein [Algoriphagus aquimarinus]|uniref:Twin-arginine translocation pathway signal protein n=1 Tax=Algoriphagus aquimarinus TaxID=237018 RepID=A0A5C7A9H0_9BACT|nr:alkaline phosphatase D family protein [Algoriphagus aquimarinus]TXE04802.1 twin-arginine translocation pathway signal protein [Algoriphagus aquimarinus]
MKRRSAVKAMALTSFSTPFFFSQGFTSIKKLLASADSGFKSNWENWPDMKWIGPEFWGNRLQDWEIIDGKAVCTISGPNRALHILTHQLGSDNNDFQQSVIIDWNNRELAGNAGAYAGFRLGAKGIFDDYRSAAIFGKGLDAGITGTGQLMIGEKLSEKRLDLTKPVTLTLKSSFKQGKYNLTLSASTSKNDNNPVVLTAEGITPQDLQGNLALVANCPNKEETTSSLGAFSDWVFQGDKIVEAADQVFGPIFFAQYTLHKNTLKLTAQLAPLELISDLKVELQLKKGSGWKTVQTSNLDPNGRIAKFRIDGWKHEEMIPYRVHINVPLKDKTQEFSYYGEIAAQPKSSENLKVAVFSCNADHGFPDQEVALHVKKHKPEMALFLGDQFYEGTGGFGIQTSPLEKSYLDYLHKWYMFGWSYRDIFRTIPAAIIPDDHDVYHGNVWGEGGKHAPTDEGWGYVAQDQGGYKMPPEWVNMVQDCQTSHLPDAFDLTPVKQGINVYYTDWEYGGVSFAILEDRKFKSAPQNVLPKEAKVMNGFIQNPDFDIKKHYNIEAELLGKRQLNFLENWSAQWNPGVQMKAVLSQTNFCTVATLPEGSIIDSMVPSLPTPEKGEYVVGDAPTSDMDSNGWPQKGRDEAVRIIRKAFALHIAGDQHLASTVQYGVDEFRDSGFAFAGPALNNLWPRRWWPKVPEGHEPFPGGTKNTGDFEDGFGNKMTIMAVANPYKSGFEPARIYDRGTGYGIITFDKNERTMKIECWPRNVDPIANPDGQYDGWPLTVSQKDNYARKAVGYLNTLNLEGVQNPLVSVYNESTGELEYAIPVNTKSFQPKVFSADKHRVEVRDQNKGLMKTYAGLVIEKDQKGVIQVNMAE